MGMYLSLSLLGTRLVPNFHLRTSLCRPPVQALVAVVTKVSSALSERDLVETVDVDRRPFLPDPICNQDVISRTVSPAPAPASHILTTAAAHSQSCSSRPSTPSYYRFTTTSSSSTYHRFTSTSSSSNPKGQSTSEIRLWIF